jgi:phosphohistidine phosphatase
MALRLLLMRHAKSAWPKDASDHDRPLADRGREAAPMIGGHLAVAGLVPSRVLVSTARRTRETYALVAEAAGLPEARFHDAIYEATWMRLLDLIHAEGGHASPLMLIGHNPGIASLAGMLADPMRSNGNALLRLTEKVPTAALAVIDFEAEDFARIQPGTGALISFITPKQLGGVDED